MLGPEEDAAGCCRFKEALLTHPPTHTLPHSLTPAYNALICMKTPNLCSTQQNIRNVAVRCTFAITKLTHLTALRTDPIACCTLRIDLRKASVISFAVVQ